jgi:hypothetical protein
VPPSFIVALAGAAVALTSGTATAQRLLAYDSFGSMVTELQPPDAVLFAANPPILFYPTAPILPPPFPGVPAPGDSTFDNVGGVHWFTDGAILAAMPSPSVPPLVPIGAPMPIIPFVMGAIGGPVTGIAIDPAAGVMFVTSVPGIVVGVAPVPGTPIIVPPFVIPFPVGAIAGNAGFALGMTGMLPFSICVFGFDTVYSPAFPTINLVGCPLGLTVSPTLLLFLATTDAAGTATFPISLLGVPVGVTLYNQGFTFCSADPTGFVFSPFQSLTIGGL